MNRHAYLIMAHNHFDFLKELLLCLDDRRNDIYLHIDKKAGSLDLNQFSTDLKESRLFFTDRLDVRWGGYSQIACELLLLKAAAGCSHGGRNGACPDETSAPRNHEKGYAYYHLLSGSDLPLKSQDEIHAFFDRHAGKEFLAFDRELSRQARERVSLWHYFRESRSPLAEPADHVLTLLQRLLHIDRLKGTGIELRKGPNWFSITDGLAQYVLEHEDWIRKHFSHSVCADELFLQTLAAASPFRENIYDEEGSSGSMANLRYVDWERGNENSPYTFQEEDKELLLGLPHLFARKFERNILK